MTRDWRGSARARHVAPRGSLLPTVHPGCSNTLMAQVGTQKCRKHHDASSLRSATARRSPGWVVHAHDFALPFDHDTQTTRDTQPIRARYYGTTYCTVLVKGVNVSKSRGSKTLIRTRAKRPRINNRTTTWWRASTAACNPCRKPPKTHTPRCTS